MLTHPLFGFKKTSTDPHLHAMHACHHITRNSTVFNVQVDYSQFGPFLDKLMELRLEETRTNSQKRRNILETFEVDQKFWQEEGTAKRNSIPSDLEKVCFTSENT